jgi:hypothetical protein
MSCLFGGESEEVADGGEEIGSRQQHQWEDDEQERSSSTNLSQTQQRNKVATTNK